MFKVTPNPPASSASRIIDPLTADRALSRYMSSEGKTPTRQSHEDNLVIASSILDSAAATAYEHADNLTGANRKVGMGVVHLIELAQRKLNAVIEDLPASATD